jgi:hypothetical protein
MAMLVIQTQIFENYGEENDPYWKAKGGCEYKIRNIPLNTDYEEIISIANIETNNAFVQEYILGWTIENDDYLSWFEKSQLEHDGSITYPEPSVEYADLIDERTVA